MTRIALLLALVSLPWSVAVQRDSSCQPLASAVVPQRTYAALNVPDFKKQVYVYAPDISTGFRGSFSAFTLWLVEGVYGPPFGQPNGSLEQRSFDKIRASRNVIVTAVPVEANSGPKRVPVTIRQQSYTLELVKVNTSLGGTDTVTVNLCR